MATRSFIYGASVAAHVALAVWVGAIEEKPKRETIAVTMAESTKKKAPPPEPAKVNDPPKPAADAAKAAPKPQAAAKAKAAEPKAEAPPPSNAQPSSASALDALPDFGLSLSGGTGPGMAVPTGGGGSQVAAAAPKATAAPKVVAPPRPADECAEASSKPKPRSVPQPSYTSGAREANVEGKVRVQVTVDADGRVTDARVLAGLGYGLDEAALAAAKQASFEPATRCGKPVSATFVIAMRFTL